MRLLHSILLIAAPAATAALSSGASSASADIVVYGPRPAFVAPAPRVYVAPAGTVTVTPGCVTRTVRVWVNGAYTYRTVRRCS